MAVAIAQNVCSILRGEQYHGVVNAPDISGWISRHTNLLPFVWLGERIGSVQGQCVKRNSSDHSLGAGGGSTRPRKQIAGIVVKLHGQDLSPEEDGSGGASKTVSDIIKRAVLKGMLEQFIDAPITYVNASAIAEMELGLPVTVQRSVSTTSDSGFRNTITVEILLSSSAGASSTSGASREGGDSETQTLIIQGTVFGTKDLHIINVNGYAVDIPVSYQAASGADEPATAETPLPLSTQYLLLFKNRDEPGVLRQIADVLATCNVNMAHFSLGRHQTQREDTPPRENKAESKTTASTKTSGLAMGAVVLDSALPDAALRQLKLSKTFDHVVQVCHSSSLCHAY